jgi:HSP20 family protein
LVHSSWTWYASPPPLPLDISENENEFIVKASLPGVRPEDVQITVHGDMLTIRAEIKDEKEKKDEHYYLRERRYGHFQRTVTLATPIAADKAQAHFENGVLTLTLPKAEGAKPKQIKVNGAAAAAASGTAPGGTASGTAAGATTEKGST